MKITDGNSSEAAVEFLVAWALLIVNASKMYHFDILWFVSKVWKHFQGCSMCFHMFHLRKRSSKRCHIFKVHYKIVCCQPCSFGEAAGFDVEWNLNSKCTCSCRLWQLKEEQTRDHWKLETMGETLIPWVKERLSFTVYFVAHEVLLKGLPQKTPPKLLYVLPNPRLHVLHFSPLKSQHGSLESLCSRLPVSFQHHCHRVLKVWASWRSMGWHMQRGNFFLVFWKIHWQKQEEGRTGGRGLGFATRIQHRTFKSQIVKRIQM